MDKESTIKEVLDRHIREIEEFVKACPHTDVVVEEGGFGGERTITLRCNRCQLNLLGFSVGHSCSYLSYVRDCVNGHPDSRKFGCTATNGANIFDALRAREARGGKRGIRV